MKRSSGKKPLVLDVAGATSGDEENSANALVSAALESYQRLKAKRGPLAVTLIYIIHSLHRHSKAIDVFCQLQPSPACILWGGVRALVQVRSEVT